MRNKRGIFATSLALLLLLTSTVAAQKKPTPSASAERVTTTSAPMPPADGRMVAIDNAEARTSPEMAARVQSEFNRRLPRDLRTYTLGEIMSAAEGAVSQASAAAKTTAPSAAKPRICIEVSCCPVKITIRWPCSGAA